MSRRILALAFAVTAFSSAFASTGPAAASQWGATGDPWIDQYIEQVPTASGGKPSGPSTPGRGTGLTSAQIRQLADAGGDRFAAAAALAAVPVQSARSGSNGSTKGHGGGSNEGGRSSSEIEPPATATAIIGAIKGTDGGLGPFLPTALIVSLVGAIAFAALRRRRHGSS